MKRLFMLLLISAMCFVFVACRGNDEPKTISPKEAVIEAAEWKVSFALTANGYKAATANVTTIEETSENEFIVYGTYSGKNEYNQSVYGTFEGTGAYNPETEKANAYIDMK